MTKVNAVFQPKIGVFRLNMDLYITKPEKIFKNFHFFVDRLYKCTILCFYICKIRLYKENCYDEEEITCCKPSGN